MHKNIYPGTVLPVAVTCAVLMAVLVLRHAIRLRNLAAAAAAAAATPDGEAGTGAVSRHSWGELM